jgi:hypothetical protein
MLSLCFASAASTPVAPVDTVLSECSVGSDTLQLILRELSDGKPNLIISAGTSTSRQSFALQTPCLDQLNKKTFVSLKVEATDPKNSSSLIVSAGIDAATGDVKSVTLWLIKVNSRWNLRGEWCVEKFNHQELGEKNESHAFAFNADSTLTRRASRNNIEGIQTTCPQGCCKIWQSRTLVTEELETLAWNESNRTIERKTFQRWYVTQFGDSLLSIAIKVFGSPEKISALYYLNASLQKQTTLETNQKVLIEKVPR